MQIQNGIFVVERQQNLILPSKRIRKRVFHSEELVVAYFVTRGTDAGMTADSLIGKTMLNGGCAEV